MIRYWGIDIYVKDAIILTTMNSPLQVIWERKLTFLAIFFVVFTALYSVLFVLDWLPEPIDQTVAVQSDPLVVTEASAAEQPLNIEIIEEETVTTPAPAPAPEPVEAPVSIVDRPVSIYFDALDKEVEVLNPTSRSIAELDAALLEGTVRHPDSATLDQEGNVFILGHSSYLPNVLNKNFQAFNGIQHLAWGDTITVTGEHNVYTYKVEDVYEAKASELFIPIADTGHRLTLATCDSFGSVDDRFIVEADLVDVTPL